MDATTAHSWSAALLARCRHHQLQQALQQHGIRSASDQLGDLVVACHQPQTILQLAGCKHDCRAGCRSGQRAVKRTCSVQQLPALITRCRRITVAPLALRAPCGDIHAVTSARAAAGHCRSCSGQCCSQCWQASCSGCRPASLQLPPVWPARTRPPQVRPVPSLCTQDSQKHAGHP